MVVVLPVGGSSSRLDSCRGADFKQVLRFWMRVAVDRSQLYQGYENKKVRGCHLQSAKTNLGSRGGKMKNGRQWRQGIAPWTGRRIVANAKVRVKTVLAVRGEKHCALSSPGWSSP